MTARADTAAAGLAELLVGDAVDATKTLAKQLGLKPRAPELGPAFQEMAAMRLACAELVFEQEGAQFQRLAAPALLRRELGNELAKPSRMGSARRRLLKATKPSRLVALVDAHKEEYGVLTTPEAIVDHHCRRLMELTKRPMASSPAGWMAVRADGVRAVQMSRTTATNLVDDGWFDAV